MAVLGNPLCRGDARSVATGYPVRMRGPAVSMEAEGLEFPALMWSAELWRALESWVTGIVEHLRLEGYVRIPGFRRTGMPWRWSTEDPSVFVR